MDKSDKRRQARLQGRHNACDPTTRPVNEKEIPRCQTEVDDVLENDAVSPLAHEIVTNCSNEENLDSQVEIASNSDRLRDGRKSRGRKHLQSDFNPTQRCFYPSRRGSRRGAANYENSNVSYDRNVEEASRSLNELSVNIDAVNKNHTADQSSSRYYRPPKSGRHMPQRTNNRNRFYVDTNEQKYNTRIKSNYNVNRGRGVNRFVYEETDQAETVIQKPKGPIPLNINGWHKLVKRNPEDKDSLLYFKPDFLGEEERENYSRQLKDSINWQEKEIIIRGEKYMQPRLVAWFGPLPYSYSNSVLEPNCEFPPIILDIKERIEKILREEQRNISFNSVLLNLYRHGKDSVGWHSDDELSMGIDPTIASVSLGETRRFEMKLRQDRRANKQEGEEYVIHLTPGSLLLMDGAMQQYWLHRVPKDFKDRKEYRINLTFRTVYPVKEK